MTIAIEMTRSIWINGNRCEKGKVVDVELRDLNTLLAQRNPGPPFKMVATSAEDLQTLEEQIDLNIQSLSGYDLCAGQCVKRYIHHQLVSIKTAELQSRKSVRETHQGSS